MSTSNNILFLPVKFPITRDLLFLFLNFIKCNLYVIYAEDDRNNVDIYLGYIERDSPISFPRLNLIELYPKHRKSNTNTVIYDRNSVLNEEIISNSFFQEICGFCFGEDENYKLLQEIYLEDIQN